MPQIIESSIIQSFLSRADLADLALFLWASGASALVLRLVRELGAANRRRESLMRDLYRPTNHGGGSGSELKSGPNDQQGMA